MTMIAAIRGAIAKGWFYNGHQPDRSWGVSARPSVKPSRHTVKAWRPTLPLSLECFPATAANYHIESCCRLEIASQWVTA